MNWISQWIDSARNGDLNWEPRPCRHPGHNPPSMMVITRPYEHVCPGCGKSVTLRPSSVAWSMN